eukprot:scaffold1836_cov204-Alexandrium_tamarense.AAC.38
MPLLNSVELLVERNFIIIGTIPSLETISRIDGSKGVDCMGIRRCIEGSSVHFLTILVATSEVKD